MTTLEKCARAAADACMEDYDEAPNLWEEVALAVLKALREPSEEMIDHAIDQFDWGPTGYWDAPQGSASPGKVFTAMIDAIIPNDSGQTANPT